MSLLFISKTFFKLIRDRLSETLIFLITVRRCDFFHKEKLLSFHVKILFARFHDKSRATTV